MSTVEDAGTFAVSVFRYITKHFLKQLSIVWLATFRQLPVLACTSIHLLNL